jgi:hypothetical protein
LTNAEMCAKNSGCWNPSRSGDSREREGRRRLFENVIAHNLRESRSGRSFSLFESTVTH